MAKTSMIARQKFRPLRFSLRTLLVLTTMFCIWLGVQADRAHRQEANLAILRQMGCHVYYDDQYVTGTVAPLTSNKSFAGVCATNFQGERAVVKDPTWWKTIIGRDFFDRAVLVSGSRDALLAALPYLKQLPHLKEVAIHGGTFVLSGQMGEELKSKPLPCNQLLRDLPNVQVSHGALVGAG